MKEVAAAIRNIGESILALADLLAEEKEAPKKEEPKKEPEPAPTLEDVRKVLAGISRKGKTAEMKELLGKFGAAKLSEVKPEDYEALLAAAKEADDA